MQVWREIKLTVEQRTAVVKALFDSGSSFTIMGHERFKELFEGSDIKKLTRPREAALLNGQKIIIDSFVDCQMEINDYLIEERIYLSPEMIKEVVLEGESQPLPDLIIGAPTLEVWGLELDLKKGEIIRRGSFIL